PATRTRPAGSYPMPRTLPAFMRFISIGSSTCYVSCHRGRAAHRHIVSAMLRCRAMSTSLRTLLRLLSALLAITCIVVQGGASVAAPAPTDRAKVLRVAFAIAETSFDPQFASAAASDAVIHNIFESMLA